MTYVEKIYEISKEAFRDASINQMSFDILYNCDTGEVYATQKQTLRTENAEYLFTIPADNDQGWIDSNDDTPVEEQFNQAFEEGNFSEWFYNDLLEEGRSNFEGLEEIEDTEYDKTSGVEKPKQEKESMVSKLKDYRKGYDKTSGVEKPKQEKESIVSKLADYRKAIATQEKEPMDKRKCDIVR